jgi:hypothetical protein
LPEPRYEPGCREERQSCPPEEDRAIEERGNEPGRPGKNGRYEIGQEGNEGGENRNDSSMLKAFTPRKGIGGGRTAGTPKDLNKPAEAKRSKTRLHGKWVVHEECSAA